MGQLLSTNPQAGLLSTDPTAGVPPPPKAPPTGAPRARVDSNAVGIDHDRILQSVANAASKLPRSLQWPAAALATFKTDLAASLLEMLSAPESIATLGAGGVPKPAAAIERPPSPSLTSRVTAATGKAIDVVDPDLVAIASPRAGAALKKAQQIRAVLAKRGVPPTKAEQVVLDAAAPTSPVESVSAAAPPPAPGPPPPAAPGQSPTAMSPQRTLNELALAARRAKVKLSDADYVTSLEAVKQGATPAEAIAALKPTAPPKLKFSADESKQYMVLRKKDMTHQEAVDAIQAMRVFQQQYGLTTPTVAETKFPKGQRGGSRPLSPLP